MNDKIQNIVLEPNDALKRIMIIEAITEGMSELGADPPVVVGGCAVEMYTCGQYMTRDIDLLGRFEAIETILKRLGFKNDGSDSIFWHEKLGIVIDWQGNGTSSGVLDVVDDSGKLLARILSVNELIIDRLCACKFWRHEDSCMWAETLYRLGQENKIGLDEACLTELAMKNDVLDLLDNLRDNKPCKRPNL